MSSVIINIDIHRPRATWSTRLKASSASSGGWARRLGEIDLASMLASSVERWPAALLTSYTADYFKLCEYEEEMLDW